LVKKISKKVENPNKDTKENQNIIETNKIGKKKFFILTNLKKF
jgi:hypothetical protein